MIDPLLRVPPHDPSAEQSVIGSIFIRNELYDQVAEIVMADDFYRENHRKIWTGIETLAAAKTPVDVVTLSNVLGQSQLEIVGGTAYLAECAAMVPAPSTAAYYAQIIREKSQQRRLVTFGSEVAIKAGEPPAQLATEWTEELIAAAEYDLAQISSRSIRKPERGKAEVLSTVLWNLEHQITNSVATGFDRVDRSFGGFDLGHLTILAARTSRGKTAFVSNIALNAAKAGSHVAFFTLEMTADEMWLRMLGREAMLDTFRARRTGYHGDERARAEQARAMLESLPLDILYRPSMRPRDLRLECRRLARENGEIKIAIVDYFNLMRGDRHERERWREMQEVILALKALAGDLGIPILLLSQLNREANESVRPQLSQLRDTGSAEEHASNVLFLWQPPTADGATSDDWADIELIIAKQRNGPAGLSIPLKFRKSWGAFEI